MSSVDSGDMLGGRLRQLRNLKGLTLKETAEASGITAAFLSQVETSKASPSVSTLKNLADVLGVSVGYFFERNVDSEFVTRRKDRKMLETGSGITYYLLSQSSAPSLEVLLNVFEVGASTGEDYLTHRGEECGIVLEGVIQVVLANSTYILESGDTISFNSSIPHVLSNIGKGEAKAIWINTPPRF